MAEAFRADGYDGVVSFESVYHPGNGDFEAGFRMNIKSSRVYMSDPTRAGFGVTGYASVR